MEAEKGDSHHYPSWLHVIYYSTRRYAHSVDRPWGNKLLGVYSTTITAFEACHRLDMLFLCHT